MGLLKEKAIHKTLRQLSKQRVVINTGHDIVIDGTIKSSEETANALMTCLLRGWVEVLDANILQADISGDLKIPYEKLKPAPLYRITEAGWSIINRSQFWVILTFIVASATLIATLIGILITIVLAGKI